MWQSHLSIIGKVFPIILPDSLTDVSRRVTLHDLAEQMLMCSLQRVQEVKKQSVVFFSLFLFFFFSFFFFCACVDVICGVVYSTSCSLPQICTIGLAVNP